MKKQTNEKIDKEIILSALRNEKINISEHVILMSLNQSELFKYFLENYNPQKNLKNDILSKIKIEQVVESVKNGALINKDLLNFNFSNINYDFNNHYKKQRNANFLRDPNSFAEWLLATHNHDSFLKQIQNVDWKSKYNKNNVVNTFDYFIISSSKLDPNIFKKIWEHAKTNKEDQNNISYNGFFMVLQYNFKNLYKSKIINSFYKLDKKKFFDDINSKNPYNLNAIDEKSKVNILSKMFFDVNDVFLNKSKFKILTSYLKTNSYSFWLKILANNYKDAIFLKNISESKEIYENMHPACLRDTACFYQNKNIDIEVNNFYIKYGNSAFGDLIKWSKKNKKVEEKIKENIDKIDFLSTDLEAAYKYMKKEKIVPTQTKVLMHIVNKYPSDINFWFNEDKEKMTTLIENTLKSINGNNKTKKVIQIIYDKLRLSNKVSTETMENKSKRKIL